MRAPPLALVSGLLDSSVVRRALVSSPPGSGQSAGLVPPRDDGGCGCCGVKKRQWIWTASSEASARQSARAAPVSSGRPSGRREEGPSGRPTRD